MLRSLISDFKKAGHNITNLIDSRLATFNPPLEADKIISVSSRSDLDKSLKKALKLSEAAYFVAPESDQSIQRLVKEAKDVGKPALNCQVSAINTAANKITTYEALRKAGVTFPETLTFSLSETIQQVGRRIRDWGFPLVFKPLIGVSCQGISVVNNENEIKMAINQIKTESSNEFFSVQKLLSGVAASTSLISTGVEAVPITLNEQLLTLKSSSSQLRSAYYGGVVPLRHQMEKKALQTAKKAVEALRGLEGYVGVDMVLTREGPVVLEINPRLTTSYVGLTKVVDFNPAQAIIDAVVERKLPRNVQVSGCTYFSKVKIKPPTFKALLESYGLGEVVSPPFPIGDDSETYALLASKADELETAKVSFETAQKRLDNIVSKE